MIMPKTKKELEAAYHFSICSHVASKAETELFKTVIGSRDWLFDVHTSRAIERTVVSLGYLADSRSIAVMFSCHWFALR